MNPLRAWVTQSCSKRVDVRLRAVQRQTAEVFVVRLSRIDRAKVLREVRGEYAAMTAGLDASRIVPDMREPPPTNAQYVM